MLVTLGHDVDRPWRELPRKVRDWILFTDEQPVVPVYAGLEPHEVRRALRRKEEPSYHGNFSSARRYVLETFASTESAAMKKRVARFLVSTECPVCAGRRLQLPSLSVTFAGLDIAELSSLPLKRLAALLRPYDEGVAPALAKLARTHPEKAAVARRIAEDLDARLAVMLELGLGYLSLDRNTPTLSPGELQRLRLATQIRSNLFGVVYVLDEPSAGLHPADTECRAAAASPEGWSASRASCGWTRSPSGARCPACHGSRYDAHTLEIHHRGKSIADVLRMTVDAAWAFFEAEPHVRRALGVLREVGLGYLRLGQPATELSGGEAQRIKLATELQRVSRGDTLYVLDEPTTGLHPADVEKLMSQLDGLVAAGNTVVVVEHDMRVVAGSDWVVDMGPGAGDEGGRVVAAGTREQVARSRQSRTAFPRAFPRGARPRPAARRHRGSLRLLRPTRPGRERERSPRARFAS